MQGCARLQPSGSAAGLPIRFLVQCVHAPALPWLVLIDTLVKLIDNRPEHNKPCLQPATSIRLALQFRL